MEHLEEVTTKKMQLSFTVDITKPEDREKLEKMGMDIAKKHGIGFEGYSVYTAAPHSVHDAVPTLYFLG